VSSSDLGRWALGALLALAGVAHAPRARAQSSAAAASDPGSSLHDWLYLRLGVGAGASNLDADLAPLDLNVSATGIAIPFEVSGGVTVVPGLALGVGVFAATMPSLSAQIENTQVNGDFSAFLFSVGPFADYVLPGAHGVHAEIGGGYARSPFHADTDDGLEADVTGGGFFLVGGFGWEGRIAEAWGLGALFRFQYAYLTADHAKLNGFDAEVDWKGSLIIPALLVTATFH
jgi:hypothetical protein